ncbi:Cell division coordinator CpoB [uncultured bacterium]|nr:Cell division coordinator CpoB [uncultured bacterium]
MKRKILIISALAFVFSGCAGMSEQQKTINNLSVEVADLKTSLSDTRAKVDDLGNKFTLLQEKMDASRADIDRLGVSSFPSAPPEGLTVVPLAEEELRYNPGPSQKGHTMKKETGEASAEAMYNKGQDLFMAGRYEEARAAFAAFLKAYPRHSLSDNALYWTGEAHYAEKDFTRALEKFREAADKYPGENKAPDALLKAGFSHMEMNEGERAKAVLEKVVATYPGTDAASRAKKALESAGAKEGTR